MENRAKRVQLMEGGDWSLPDLSLGLNIQTPVSDLRRKLRCYALLFDEVIISAGDYGQSDTLHEAAITDSPLWKEKGSVRLGLAKKIGSMKDYYQVKFGHPEQKMWRGKPCDPQKIKDAVYGRIMLVADELKTPIQTFDETQAIADLRAAAMPVVEKFGPKKLASAMQKEDKGVTFNRDPVWCQVQECFADSDPSKVQALLEYFNMCYYFNGASAFKAELGVHDSQRRAYELFARVTAPGSTMDKTECQQFAATWADHYVAVKNVLCSVFEKAYVPWERVLSLSPDGFHELVNGEAGVGFRKSMWSALPPAQSTEQLYALREVPIEQDAISAFAEKVRTMLEREKKWIGPIRSAERIGPIATLGLAAAGLLAGALAGFITDQQWRDTAERAGGIAAGIGCVFTPVGRLAATALRNRTCPLLTFMEKAKALVDKHIPAQ